MAIFLGVPSSPKFAEFMAMEEGKRKKVEATGIKAWETGCRSISR